MRICVLLPSYRDSGSPIKDLDPRRDLGPLLPGHEVEHAYLDKATVARQVKALSADVFVNLCDGAWDEDTPGLDVVRALEREGRAFTGSGSSFYDPTRRAMKLACLEHGIPTPPFRFVKSAAEADEAARELRPPWFVKPEHGYNSVGIDPGSRCTDAAALRARVERVTADFGGALVEEYIAGREFSVLVASDPGRADRPPHAYRPVECRFAAGLGFKTFEDKWRGSRNPWLRCDDGALAARLQDMTRDLFLALEGDGYARSDVRMDPDGNLHLLEINPNCSVFYPLDNGATADLILALDGTGQAGFLRRLIEHALARRDRTAPRVRVGFSSGRGYGLFAVQPLAPGERILAGEERPHRLVSGERVERAWSAAAREVFRRYAWPIGDGVHVLWDEDPEAWRPLNHSCDPNAWVTGLDLTARRAIAAGEEVTFDYATMYTGGEASFSCACRSPLCRGGFDPGQQLEPWFLERYGEHVTSAVRERQRRLGGAVAERPAAPAGRR